MDTDRVIPDTLPLTTRAEERLATTKPTQEAMDSAMHVVQWLQQHSQYFPEEYATVGDPQAIFPRQALLYVMNACGVDVTMLVTSAQERTERDAYNRQLEQS
jgi:hypothetical protein